MQAVEKACEIIGLSKAVNLARQCLQFNGKQAPQCGDNARITARLLRGKVVVQQILVGDTGV